LERGYGFTGTTNKENSSEYSLGLLTVLHENYEKFKKWQSIAQENRPPAFNKSFSGQNYEENWVGFADPNSLRDNPQYNKYGNTVAFSWDGKEAYMAVGRFRKVELLSAETVDEYESLYSEGLKPLFPKIKQEKEKRAKIQEGIEKARSKADGLFK